MSLLVGSMIVTALGAIAAVVLLKQGFSPPPHDPTAEPPEDHAPRSKADDSHGTGSPPDSSGAT